MCQNLRVGKNGAGLKSADRVCVSGPGTRLGCAGWGSYSVNGGGVGRGGGRVCLKRGRVFLEQGLVVTRLLWDHFILADWLKEPGCPDLKCLN